MFLNYIRYRLEFEINEKNVIVKMTSQAKRRSKSNMKMLK